MKKIGITGQNGFIGNNLYHTLQLSEDFELIDFKADYFKDDKLLDEFVTNCDVIVHLAALNRHESQQVIYDTNVDLVDQLIKSAKKTAHQPHIIFSSSTKEERDNLYGKSKKEGRNRFQEAAEQGLINFTGMLIPNVFGAFCKPFYNSFIATFCHQLTHGDQPEIHQDASVKLIYVQELIQEIIRIINDQFYSASYDIAPSMEIKVSEVLKLVNNFKQVYFDKGEIPALSSGFHTQLFNTFRSYIDHKNHFPVRFTKHSDDRGSFVEIIRLGVGGQVSFSTTKPSITRGNHYHTRKIERFAVIKGKALIQLRKIGTDEVINFELYGDEPAYVDMPIWYTHNIKNIGDEVLYTNFWINESFNPNDADTWYEDVEIDT